MVFLDCGTPSVDLAFRRVRLWVFVSSWLACYMPYALTIL